MDSTVITYYFDNQAGELSIKQIVSTLPNNVEGNTGAEIVVAPSGRFVYVSNRGQNSIAIFSVDQESGLLSNVGWESTRGETPRFITLDPYGRFLYAANEDSDTIVKFSVNELTGELIFTGDIIITGSPVSIHFK